MSLQRVALVKLMSREAHPRNPEHVMAHNLFLTWGASPCQEWAE